MLLTLGVWQRTANRQTRINICAPRRTSSIATRLVVLGHRHPSCDRNKRINTGHRVYFEFVSQSCLFHRSAVRETIRSHRSLVITNHPSAVPYTRALPQSFSTTVAFPRHSKSFSIAGRSCCTCGHRSGHWPSASNAPGDVLYLEKSRPVRTLGARIEARANRRRA